MGLGSKSSSLLGTGGHEERREGKCCGDHDGGDAVKDDGDEERVSKGSSKCLYGILLLPRSFALALPLPFLNMKDRLCHPYLKIDELHDMGLRDCSRRSESSRNGY